MQKLYEPFQNKDKFLIAVLVYIFPHSSGSVDPNIVADPDHRSQNVAKPTNPDPMHWINQSTEFEHLYWN